MLVKIQTPNEMMELSEEGKKKFEKEVLEGPLFKKVLQSIEDSALKGYTGYRRKIHSQDEVRSLKVIQKYLQAAGYKCEFETEKRLGLISEYDVHYFVIRWK
ncbi:hypothetical protein ACFFF5_17940 [Lederbergia wuyishanensis]|uniref:LAGLIDADG homing endonuclease n=1 Tax=Lederbergia wuyishanensis TaxID=1347903 RepID=A0ABU0D4I4_9BACI|nr:hypothetical protein [Lederbergia wuyishanensis]MCJ8008091.1 hypothetical protein [Lederbergia wuyishanensis]MDQ0343323.1 hypothetical protein [Lederbergia wuyishanensis]